MSMNILNDISAVYLQQIVEKKDDSYLETDMNKRHENNERAREEMKKTKANKDMVKSARKSMGIEDDDINETKKPNDGNLANNYPPYDKITRGDVIAGRLGKDEMGGKKKNKKMKESFSNWRQDLFEVMDDTEANQKITEKKVKNKIKTSAMGGGIKIGEAIEKIGGTLLEMIELDDIDLTEEIDIATEYFYEQGLNEEGIDILIEELGIEGFVDFVYEISEEYILVEARTLTGKKKSPAMGKERGVSLKAAPGKTTKAAVEKYGTTRKLSSSPSATIKKKSVAVKKAVEKQPETKSSSSETKKGIAGRVGAALGAVVKKGREDIKRVQDAAQTARNVATRRGAEAKAVYDAVRERGKKAEQSATATRARRKATVAAGRAAQAAAPVVKKAVKAGAAAAGAGVGSLRAGKSPAASAGRAAGTFVRKLNAGYEFEGELVNEAVYGGEPKKPADTRMVVTAADKKANTKAYQEFKKGNPKYKAAEHLKSGYDPQGFVLDEKAESEQQQKLFGLALSVKRGQTPRSEASPQVLKIVDSMSEKKIRDFAKTKHEGIPKKVEEDLQPTTPQQFAAQRQLAMAQKKVTAADQASLKMKKKEVQQQEEFVSEEDYDRMKDRHLERGGMGARSSTSPAKMSGSKPVDREKQKEIAKRALELVRQQTMSKYGKKSLM